ncbi:FAD-binding protein [Microbacterium sp. ASV49]|uniref:FAD-binding protein n=1 Tax=Microbacterium candidum TaxID=3041922 RepID=A0ABT7MXW7_9MICO|nr:FAD-binding protein [Microbacterium sp. ASV49]MDL9979286.1 FAD-binding protein [Microbacterium sp. ASV49]
MSEQNWAGTHTYAGRVVSPRSLGELQRVVAGAPHMRALGTRHSFNDIADSEVLVSLRELPADVEVDVDAASVRVAAQVPYAAVAMAVDAAGLALHNMGSLPHISVGGATATATHGSGLRLGNLSTAVTGLELVTADGGILLLDRDDPRFAGAVVHLGAIGVVTHLTLALEPRFDMRQDVYLGVPWDEVLGDPVGVFGAADSVSVFGHWSGERAEQVWLKSRELAPPPDAWRGGVRAMRQVAPVDDGGDNTTRQGEAGPWHARLPHFRFDRQPSAQGDEIQSEYFVALEDAASALSAVRGLRDRIDPLLLVTELRTVAADDLWLSTAHGRNSLAIHFTWRSRPAEVAALLPEIEAALEPFAPRPHWGKWFASAHASERYELLEDAVALMRELDPSGVFRNAYTRRVLGLE